VLRLPPKRPAQYVAHIEGDLALVTNGAAKADGYDRETRRSWHSQLKAIAMMRDYKPGWVAHKYREKFGAFPNWGSTPEPIAPTDEVLSWVRSRQIAYAKRRGAA
jgi:DNA repair protein RadD